MTPRLTVGPTLKFTTDANGYTHVEAPADYIHVVGDDPVETHNAMRDSGNVGGVVVYRAGRTYSRPFGDASGVCKVPSSVDKPLVLISDDSVPERPVLLSGFTGACFNKQVGRMDGLRLIGFHCKPHPGESSVLFLGPGSRLLVEDVECEGGQVGINCQGDANGSPFMPDFSKCVIYGQRRANGHSQGVFIGAESSVPELADCVIDDIGDSMYEHGVYVTGGSGKLLAAGNIITRAHGGHAIQGRSGLGADSNFIARCAAGMLAGGGDDASANDPAGVGVEIHNNVFQDAVGIGWGLELSNIAGGYVRRNLWTMGDNAAFALRLQGKTDEARTGMGCKYVDISENVWDHWRGGMEVLDGENGTVQIASMRGHTYKPVNPGRTVQHYYRTAAEGALDLAHVPEAVSIPQPGDFERFISAAKKATNYHSYDPRYGAEAVCKYMRAGWGMP